MYKFLCIIRLKLRCVLGFCTGLKPSRSADKFIICYTEFSSVGGCMLKKRELFVQAGFSLVELMIVVAIIGVLTAIAIPNFQAFQARSRQSEAKAALTSIYTAEQAFHSQWEVYAAPFKVIGYDPGGNYRYVAGFDDAVTGGKKFCGTGGDVVAATAALDLGCGPAPGRKYTGIVGTDVVDKEWNTETYCESARGASCDYVGLAAVDAKLNETVNSNADDTKVGVNTFIARAAGNPAGATVTVTDIKTKGDWWQINEDKELDHVLDQLDEVQSN